MEKFKANVSIFNVCNIAQQRKILSKSLNDPAKPKQKSAASTEAKQKLMVNTTIIRKKSNSQTPPFLLTFEISNHDIHNCLVDSRETSNVVPDLKRINSSSRLNEL